MVFHKVLLISETDPITLIEKNNRYIEFLFFIEGYGSPFAVCVNILF